jgi:hypothetical protein
MAAKKFGAKTAELVSLKYDRNQKPPAIVLQYHPVLMGIASFNPAYGLVTQEDGDKGPIQLACFGDESNMKRLRAAWKDWALSTDDSHSFEWTPRNAVRAFVRWLNRGGEARAARARAARRGRA